MKLFICLVLVALASAGPAPEKELAKHLLTTYNELGVVGRPVTNGGDTVKVTMAIHLQSVIKMEKNSITIAVWTQMSWNDPFLTWLPEKFGGIKSLTLPASAVWKPDIVNYEDIHHKPADHQAGMNTADVLVQSDGTVLWIPRTNYQSICDFDFNEEEDEDRLICPFKFGSWAHDASQIDVFFDKDQADFNMQSYRPSPLVEIISHSAEKLYNTYDCCPGQKYPVLSYTMTVRKAPKGTYYTTDTCKNGEQCSGKP